MCIRGPRADLDARHPCPPARRAPCPGDGGLASCGCRALTGEEGDDDGGSDATAGERGRGDRDTGRGRHARAHPPGRRPAAGLPEGSCSFRARQALLQATLGRILELEVAEIIALAEVSGDNPADRAVELAMLAAPARPARSRSNLGAASFAGRDLRKVFPDHWSFLPGEIALYSFVLLLTGAFLTFLCKPSMGHVKAISLPLAGTYLHVLRRAVADGSQRRDLGQLPQLALRDDLDRADRGLRPAVPRVHRHLPSVPGPAARRRRARLPRRRVGRDQAAAARRVRRGARAVGRGPRGAQQGEGGDPP